MEEEQVAEEIRQCEEAIETKWIANAVFVRSNRGSWGKRR